MGKVAVTRSKPSARRQMVPLSRVGENHPSRKWQGAFKIDPAALKDERVAAIAAKHMR